VILLTGASGVVGQALLDRLPADRVIGLAHRSPVEGPGVETIQGDVVEPRYGLSEQEFKELARRIDYIVHAAATTNFFTAAADDIEFANVRGTERTLELASVADAPVYYISTAFVGSGSDSADGPGDERRDLPGIAAAAEGYRMSKRESESRVRDSGLDNVILRPSIMFGDSRTGEMSRFQGIHATFREMLNGEVPAIPVSPDGRLDLIPQDVVADAVVGLVERDQRDGLFWITLGDRALPVRRLAELCVEQANEHGVDVQVPAFVDPEAIDQLLEPDVMAQLPAEARVKVERQLASLVVAGPREPLPSSLPELESRGVLSLPDPDTAFVNGFLYWARKTGIIAEDGSA
jgi:nucleoside-diphosphate-sugar epimerase